MLGQLAKVPLAQCPFYIHAVVKASMSAPDKYIQNGKVKMITAAGIATMTDSNKDRVIAAHRIQMDARSLVVTWGLPWDVH